MSLLRDSAAENERLVRYLVGLLPADEAERLDEQSIVDDDVACRLLSVENDLVDAYVREQLDPALQEDLGVLFRPHAAGCTSKRRHSDDTARRPCRNLIVVAAPAQSQQRGYCWRHDAYHACRGIPALRDRTMEHQRRLRHLA